MYGPFTKCSLLLECKPVGSNCLKMSTDANGCPVCAGSPGGNPGDIGNYL